MVYRYSGLCHASPSSTPVDSRRGGPVRLHFRRPRRATGKSPQHRSIIGSPFRQKVKPRAQEKQDCKTAHVPRTSHSRSRLWPCHPVRYLSTMRPWCSERAWQLMAAAVACASPLLGLSRLIVCQGGCILLHVCFGLHLVFYSADDGDTDSLVWPATLY